MNPEQHDPLEELRRPLARASNQFTHQVLDRVHGHRRRVRRRDLCIRGTLTVCLLSLFGLAAHLHGWLHSTPERVASARAGVEWLLESQQADGGWDAAETGGHPAFAQGVSALAMLALLNAPEPAPREALDAGAAYLGERVAAHRPGRFSGPEFYNHLLSLNTLLELESRRPDPGRRNLLGRSLHALIRRQQTDGGWGYDDEAPLGYAVAGEVVSNSAVTWWVCHLLRQARDLRPAGSEEALARGDRWLAARFRGPYGVQYRPDGDFEAGPENALYWMAARQVAGLETAQTGDLTPDAYRDLFRMGVLRRDAPVEGVVRTQNRSGAWERPEDRWWSAGGMVYVTAASVLSLVPQGV